MIGEGCEGSMFEGLSVDAQGFCGCFLEDVWRFFYRILEGYVDCSV